MEEESGLILIGVISAAHGIKGDLVVKSFTDPKENILKLSPTDLSGKLFKLKKIRVNTNGNIICKYEGSLSRNDAEALSGTKLYCRANNLPRPKEDEFYINELKSMNVVNNELEVIGVIMGVANFGGGDIIEIKFKDDREEMFPFTKEFFPEISKDYVVLSKPTIL